MKFKSYLLTEGRIKKLSYEQLEKLAFTKFSDAREIWENENGYIYRGTNSLKADYAIGNGKGQRLRKSRNTTNHSTLFFDNSKMWSSYPKRSESFICSTEYDRASVYGETFGAVYHVLPANGSKIGVCSDGDIFISFNKTLPGGYVGQVNAFIVEMIDIYSEKFDVDLYTGDDDWGKMKGSFDKILQLSKDNPEKLKEISDYISPYVDDVLMGNPFDGDMMSLINHIYNPKMNGFSIVKSGQPLPKNREVWMSGDCLFINTDVVGQF